MKKFFILLIGLFFIFFCSSSCFAKEINTIGKALNLQYQEVSFGTPQLKQIVEVKILNGKDKGSIVKIDNILSANPYYDINVQPNNLLILHTDTENNENSYYIADIYRQNTLVFLVGLFCFLVLTHL